MWGTILSQNSPQSSWGRRLFSFGIDVVSLLSGHSASFLRSTCYYFPVIKVVKSVIRWKSNQWHDMTRWHLYWIEWIKWVAGDVTVFFRHAWDVAEFSNPLFYVFLLKYLLRIASIIYTFNILKQSWDESTDWALPNRIEASMSFTRLEHSSAEDECSCNEFGVKRSWTNFRELSDRQSCNDILEKSVKQSMQQIMSFLIGILAHRVMFIFGV